MNSTPEKAKTSEQANPGQILGFSVFCVSVAFTLLALSSYTYQLDDIKIIGLYVGGSISLALWSILWFFGKVDNPPLPVWVGLVGYLLVSLVSILTTEPYLKWIGWEYLGYYTAAFGYVLLGSSIIATYRMAEMTLKFWVLITFVTTAFGVFHYGGLMGPLLETLFPNGRPAGEAKIFDLLLTFEKNRGMLSTILNTQFFGNFLTMTLPITLACTTIIFANLKEHLKERESVVMPILWLAVSAISVLFALACILLTYSKSSIIALGVVIILFPIGLFAIAGVRRIPYLWIILPLGLLFGALITNHVWVDLTSNFTEVEKNLGPRKIILGGAFDIWKANPIVGAGPGSFRFVFPQFRSPDYHMNRVSNLTLYAHNWAMEILAQLGTLGFISYMILLGGAFWLALKAMRRSRVQSLRVAILGCFVGTLALLTGAMMTPFTSWPVGTVTLHAIIGTLVGLSVYTLRREETEPTESPVWWKTHGGNVRGLVALGCIVAAVRLSSFGVTYVQAAYHHNLGIRNSEYQQVPAGSVVGLERDFALVTMAVASFERALELYDGLPSTWYKLANAYNKVGRIEDSLATYHKLREYAPDYSEIHYNLAVMYYTYAVELNEQLKTDTSDELRKKRDDAFRNCAVFFEKATDQSNKVNVWYYRGVTLSTGLDLGAFPADETEALYREVGDHFMRAATVPISTVILESGQADSERKLQASAAIQALMNYEKGKDYRKAGDAAKSYLQFQPNNTEYLVRAVENYGRAGEYEEALRLIDTALQANPVNGTALRYRFELLADAGRIQDAIEEGEYLLKLNELLGSQAGELISAGRVRIIESLLADLKKQESIQQ